MANHTYAHYGKKVCELTANGTLDIHIHTYPFTVEGLREAQTDLVSEKTVGKLVINVTGIRCSHASYTPVSQCLIITEHTLLALGIAMASAVNPLFLKRGPARRFPTHQQIHGFFFSAMLFSPSYSMMPFRSRRTTQNGVARVFVPSYEASRGSSKLSNSGQLGHIYSEVHIRSFSGTQGILRVTKNLSDVFCRNFCGASWTWARRLWKHALYLGRV